MKTPINQLTEPGMVLRPVTQFEQHLLEETMRTEGLLTPLVVCNNVIVDGYRRWLVAKGLGWSEIECNHVEGDPVRLRVICQTRSSTFGKTEKKILVSKYLDANPGATAGEMAHEFKWSPIEVEEHTGVPWLVPEAKEWYANGKIPLSTVWHLSRARDVDQLKMMEGPFEDLRERVINHLREVKAARRRATSQKPRMKSYNKVEKELTHPVHAGPALVKYEASTPLDGWRAALRWVLEQS